MDTQKELGFDAIVDTVADVLNASTVVGNALKDGFQFTDMPSLLAVVPNIQNIVKKGNVAVAQLLDLTPEEADRAAQQVAQRTSFLPGAVVARTNEALSLLARTYGQVKSVQYLAADWVRWGSSLHAARELQQP